MLGTLVISIFVLSGPIAEAVGQAIGVAPVVVAVWGVAKWFVLAATVGFVIYVANFANYNATYGALAGVIILLLWMYIINAILLVGAQLDSELERNRELRAGLPAELVIQLPARDTRASDKRAQMLADEVARAKRIRELAG